MSAIPDNPVWDTELISEERRNEINAGLQHELSDGTIITPLWRRLNQGEYDDLADYLTVGDTTIKEWFQMYIDGDPPTYTYRPCLPPEIVGRRSFRIVPLPGHAPRLDEEGTPVTYPDLQYRNQMRRRLWLCALLGRDALGLPVGYEREPLFDGKDYITEFYMTTITGCMRKMQEIYNSQYTYFLYMAWYRFFIVYNEHDEIGPQGWVLICQYKGIALGSSSEEVQNFPPVDAEAGEVA